MSRPLPYYGHGQFINWACTASFQEQLLLNLIHVGFQLEGIVGIREGDRHGKGLMNISCELAESTLLSQIHKLVVIFETATKNFIIFQ